MNLASPVLLLLALLLLALPAPASLDLDKQGGGLGGKLEFTLTGDASEAFLLLPSATAGPTPLAWFDPLDPRSLQVGLDALYLAAPGALDGKGLAKVTYPLPAAAALNGVRLYWQAFTVPGSTYLVDDLSNRVVSSLGLPSCFLKVPGAMPFSTALPGAAPLPGNRALVCGGAQGNLTSGTAIRKAAVYDGLSQTWSTAPDMRAQRLLGITVGLKDGRVLVCGGADTQGAVTSSCEIYDPAQNRWLATGSMKSPRAGHAGVLLPDGKVLVSGGVGDLSDPLKAITGAHKSAELFDPKTGTWSSTGSMKKVRIAHTLTLSGTKAVAVSGLSYYLLIFVPVPEFTRTCEYYSSGSWRSAGSLKQGRAAHSAIALTNGRVLVTGGVFSTNILDLNSYKAIGAAELSSTSATSWSTLPAMKQARALPTLILRPDGKVLVCGGAQGTYLKPLGLQSVELFSGSAFSLHSCSLDTPRVGMGLVQLDDGSCLLAAGAGGPTNSSLGTALILFP